MTAQTRLKSSSAPSAITGPIKADLNYIKPDTKLAPEVFYSGGSTPQKYNEAYAFMPAMIEDGRDRAKSYGIHKQGFELVKFPTSNTDFGDPEAIEGLYYDEVSAIVRNTTGAKHVFVFDHTIRLGKKNSLRKPAHHVPVSYTHLTLPTKA